MRFARIKKNKVQNTKHKSTKNIYANTANDSLVNKSNQT